MVAEWLAHQVTELARIARHDQGYLERDEDLVRHHLAAIHQSLQEPGPTVMLNRRTPLG